MPNAATLERRTKAVELLAAGLSYDEIADQLGYSNRSGAWKAVQRALGSQQVSSVAEYRLMEGDRLDALQAAVWEQAMGGDVKAVGLILRIIDRRVRLFGLVPDGKSPTKHRSDTSMVAGEFWQHVRDAHGGDLQRCHCHEAE